MGDEVKICYRRPNEQACRGGVVVNEDVQESGHATFWHGQPLQGELVGTRFQVTRPHDATGKEGTWHLATRCPFARDKARCPFPDMPLTVAPPAIEPPPAAAIESSRGRGRDRGRTMDPPSDPDQGDPQAGG